MQETIKLVYRGCAYEIVPPQQHQETDNYWKNASTEEDKITLIYRGCQYEYQPSREQEISIDDEALETIKLTYRGSQYEYITKSTSKLGETRIVNWRFRTPQNIHS
jgi:hypothetical protein